MTIGKTVTLEKGVIVTDVGPWINSDGAILSGIRRCVRDDGSVEMILDRVIEELPVTHRRAEINPEHHRAWPENWHRY